MANWGLKSCCNNDQVAFLVTIAVFTVVILALWRTVVLMPFKLITVFLHEASHAIACKLTCGHVEGIQVHANEGGVTQTRGGVYWLILPAGCNGINGFIIALHPDLGSSFWGMALILASTNLLTARIAAGCFLLALVVVLFYAKNWTLRGLCIGFIIFLAIIWLLQEKTKVRILRYVILFIGIGFSYHIFPSLFHGIISFSYLFYEKEVWLMSNLEIVGVMNSLFSVYDIYDDLISRRVHSSDAEKFAEICPCPCNGVGWGFIWGMISFLFLAGAMYLGLVILS
ncbi:hypothetical protein QQP08_014659 [Theobroma cacao]|nr:hypothetical protein QQP08_014659 [Theobroma cacao]